MAITHGVNWHVSSKSDTQQGTCVEAGPFLDGSPRVAVRDTKDRTGPALVFHTADWVALLGDIRTGGPTSG